MFVLPFVVGVLSLIALRRAVQEWRRREWSRPWRWHFTAVTLASVGFAILTIHWGLI